MTTPLDGEVYIVWNPLSDFPPKKRYEKQEQAQHVADACAAKYKQPFYVMKAVAVAMPGVQP